MPARTVTVMFSGDEPGDVGRYPVHWIIVGIEHVFAAQHRLRLRRHVQPLGDLRRRLHVVEVDRLPLPGCDQGW